MSLSSTAQRQALHELPLERFLSGPSDDTHSLKRPLSPGGLNIFSPAKRRILNDEGIISLSPTTKSQSHGHSPLRGWSRPSTLSSPINARKLEFAIDLEEDNAPMPSPTDTLRSSASSSKPLSYFDAISTPPKSTTTTPLAPSPELVTMATPNSTRSHLLTTTPSNFSSSFNLAQSSIAPPTPQQPALLPRDLPSTSDPLSIHYPGFEIYKDPHIVLLHTLPSSTIDALDKESSKENTIPHRLVRKARKSSFTSSPEKTLFLTPEEKRAKRGDVLEKKIWHAKYAATASPPLKRLFGIGAAGAEANSVGNTVVNDWTME